MRNNDQSNFPVGWCLRLLVLPLDLAGMYIKQRQVLKPEWASESPRRLVEYKCPFPYHPLVSDSMGLG